MADALTNRRFDGNTDNWSLKMSTSSTTRTVATHSLRGTNANTLQNTTNSLQLSRPLNKYKSYDLSSMHEEKDVSPSPTASNESGTYTPAPTSKTKCDQLKDIYQQIKIKMKDTITDQWRRATQSGNDPYVKVSLKPKQHKGNTTQRTRLQQRFLWL